MHRRTPRSLFTTRVASASASISSATRRRGSPDWATRSSRGRRSFMVAMRLSVRRILGLSRDASIFSGFVTK
jgi:hypothetical protein